MRVGEEDNTSMRSSQSDSGGFALAVLMVIMGMAAIWMAASLPAWKHNATREKEAELVFRGQQYARALSLYQRKMGPGSTAQNFDQLYDAKFLRKKYKDPITNDDFLPLYRSGTPQGGQQPGQQQPTGPGQGGALMGVQSKSTASSIMVYNGATHYNEWQFIMSAPQQGPNGRPGAPGGGPNGTPVRGGGPNGGPNGGPGRGPGGGPGVGPGGGPGGNPGRGPGVQPGPGRGPVPTGPGRGRGLF